MASLPTQPSSTQLDVPLTLKGEEVDSHRVRLADPDPADGDDDDEEADSDQGQELSVGLELSSAEDDKKSRRASPMKNQQVMPMEPLLVGDVLIDVPAAEEYGDLGVSTLKDEPGDFDAFMNNYGIVTHTHKKTRLSKDSLIGYLPECIAWMPLALKDAARRASEEDEDVLADEAVHAGSTISFKLRLRQRMLISVGGTIQAGRRKVLFSYFGPCSGRPCGISTRRFSSETSLVA